MKQISFIVIFSVIQRLLTGESNPPNKVLEIRSESLCLMHIMARDDSMVLYASSQNANDQKINFEIVLQRPHTDTNTTSFSLYRSSSYDEAMEKFNTFMDRLPIFVKLVKEVNFFSSIYITLIIFN